ncbi:MAG: aspartate carbamoyltransferase [Peptoniphilaceae bacterium]|nr:aspartate carbamoyltransferase [Peptoniphilaceae bacterium]MDY6085790.1 aspartate carbamoyltransferase [Peptoniphilaceae bacterium]
MPKKDLIDIQDLSTEEIDDMIALAEEIIDDPARFQEVCAHRILGSLFYEPSTRTRLSFESAMLSLGGQVIGFSEAGASSVAKGESVADTARTVECFADIIAMRHPKEGAPFVAAQSVDIPVINAGDGGHNHPTQTLTDLLTIHREMGHLDKLVIGACGDLKFGRTVHSLIAAMSRYANVEFVLISPEELVIPEHVRTEILDRKGIPYREVRALEDVIGELDILYMTRVQRERFFNEADYIRLKDTYILTPERMAQAKPEMRVLHPLPRVNEISVKVDKDPRAAYFRQVKNGKFIRMALIMTLLGVNA